MAQTGDVMEWGGAQDAIALAALVLAIASFAFSAWLDRRANRRDDRIEKSSAYLQLEIQSGEAFRFAAENGKLIRPYESTRPPRPRPSIDNEAARVARQYYYQCLNLFEVCASFRRNGVIDKVVYASWVAWFHELLDQWYFRELWQAGMRENYTPDMRGMFDIGVKIYQTHKGGLDDELRKREFYKAVSHLQGGCRVIDEWLDQLAEKPEWPPAEPKPALFARLRAKLFG